MNDGSESLSPDEYVLRRVSAFGVDKNLPIPIPPGHFRPNKDDVDGISLFRRSCKTPEQLVENATGRHGYYVVKYQVKELVGMGLNPRLTGDVSSGHVSIPELSLMAVNADPDAAESLMTKLAIAAWPRVVLDASKTL